MSPVLLFVGVVASIGVFAYIGYLQAKKRREFEMRLANAYAGEADTLLEEVEVLLSGQSWPSD